MFEAIKQIKNGYVVSTMYGRYAEAMYARPQIIFCFIFSFNIKNYANRRIITRFAAPTHSDNEKPPVTGAAAIL